MIYIPSKTIQSSILIPRSSSFLSAATMTLFSKTRGIVATVSDVMPTTFFWKADINSVNIPDGEYEYQVLDEAENVLDAGLAQVGEYVRTITSEKLTNKKITYEG